MTKPNIILSEQDLQRLETMLENQSKLSETMIRLEDELARAEVVEPKEIASNIVTMHSRVLLTIAPSTEAVEVTLVYPHEFNGEKGRSMWSHP